jgi:hypothetical protein
MEEPSFEQEAPERFLSARLNTPKLVGSQGSQISAVIAPRETSKKEVRPIYRPDAYATWQLSTPSGISHPQLPRTHRLLELYLTYATSRICPGHLLLPSNPLISSVWFRHAVTDAGMLHAMLYFGALYRALLQGRTETKDTMYHQNYTISNINDRLNTFLTSSRTPSVL